MPPDMSVPGTHQVMGVEGNDPLASEFPPSVIVEFPLNDTTLSDVLSAAPPNIVSYINNDIGIRNILILTERIEHAEILKDMLSRLNPDKEIKSIT